MQTPQNVAQATSTGWHGPAQPGRGVVRVDHSRVPAPPWLPDQDPAKLDRAIPSRSAPRASARAGLPQSIGTRLRNRRSVKTKDNLVDHCTWIDGFRVARTNSFVREVSPPTNKFVGATHQSSSDRVLVQAACLLLILLLPTGCGFSGGQALYMLGVGKGQKVEAKFHLTEGPLLILFDDLDRVDVPTFEMHLHDAVSQELLKHKAAQKIIPYDTIQHLRRTWPEFPDRGAREIGVKAQAEQVLWLEVQDFALSRESFDPERAAIITVSVKVINPLEAKDKSNVRLWPSTHAGHLISASLSAPEVTLCQNDQVLSRKLSLELADKIAKLFYDRRLEDTEQPEE